MNFLPGLKGLVFKAVFRATPLSPSGKARRESFVLRQLLISLAASAAASVCVAMNGTPGFSDALVFFWLIFPSAILILSASGKLMAAEAMSSLRFTAAGLTAAFGGGALHPAASAWLVIALIESVFSPNGLVAGASGTLAAVVALLLAATADAPAAATNASLLLIPAAVFITIAGTGFARLRTLLRKAEQTQAEWYDSLAGTMGCLAVRCDRSGSALSVSSNCADLFGLPPSELLGRGFFERVQVADRPAFLKTISEASAGSGTVNAALRWRGPARVERGDYAEPVFLWLEMRARRSGEQAIQGGSQDEEADEAIAIFRDITRAKLREAELEDALAAAEEARHAKEYFLAHAGHELRAPLNAIIGFSELLGDMRLAPPDPEKQREYARIIHQSGLHLLSVVNSILNMSKIQSGSMAFEPEPFAVAPLIDLCCGMVKLHARNGGVALLRAYPENPGEITGDKRACTQILINLLSNAIKFTPPNGSVTIGVRPESHFLLILVADTGIGIAERDLAHLGDPFFQVQASPDGQDKGTGLGLSIVRGLVGLQGGTIAVASEPGKGTCVHVRLPLDCRGLAAKGSPARIETIAGFPGHGHRDLFQKMTVQKIA